MSLEALIAPKSIAIIGASPNPSIGLSVIKSLQTLGFDGPVLPINPKYSEVAGETCFASLDDLPETPDVVAFCLNNAGVLAGFRQLADRGIRAAVIYGGGFAEKDEDGARMQAEIVGLAREGGISLCGPIAWACSIPSPAAPPSCSACSMRTGSPAMSASSRRAARSR
jgi:acyl-CoA synthetase (NDP forming)